VSEASAAAPLPAAASSGASGPRPWRWIPTLYFAQALPNVAVATLSVVMYKNLGLSNTDIALYTSWLYLPWVIKPLWSPLVDLLGSKRGWTVGLQFVTGVAFALVAFALPAPHFFQLTLAMFWLLAFACRSRRPRTTSRPTASTCSHSSRSSRRPSSACARPSSGWR
jgi:PAT family beta-lactamase induction signal transducer AmpG